MNSFSGRYIDIVIPKLKCKLYCHSISPHVQQLYTGFKMLHDNGLIDLSQEILPQFASNRGKVHALKEATHAQLRAEVINNTNNRKMLIFDSHDSKIINKKNLLNCDLYFKRSFDRKYISEFHLEEKDKIFPLG